MADQQTGNKSPEYKATLNLPHTDFPLRAQAALDDPRILERWQKSDLYRQATELHKGNKTFILHDGPPYANGNIHLGHAYNKILKDIISKAYRMAGFHAPVKPGWDCHGLPIELKVTKEQPNPEATPAEIMRSCRAAATYWIGVQREEFKRLGVVMDWDNPYITMDYSYEAATMRAFGIFVNKGFIERKFKTVTWCMFCETSLASAEIEYHERKDPSLYVLFPLVHEVAARLMPGSNEPVNLLVWTTTPWTLPLNRAVALKPKSAYLLVRLAGKLLIVGEKVLASIEALAQEQATVLKHFAAEELSGGRVVHPIVSGKEVPIIFDEHVGIDEGTACVHIAPGCGPSDYELGVRYGLEIYSPVGPNGSYDNGVEPSELVGMKISDAQGWVIRYLESQGRLFHKGSIRHSYPHCWRCRNGLMYRATRQWFLSLEHDNLRTHALEAIDVISFMPARGANFLKATVGSRWEWCLSRQRVWGTPIAALICTHCDEAYTNEKFIEHVAQLVAQHGIEYWREVPVADVAGSLVCTQCGSASWRKETDILDVWFDSGVSHYAVLGTEGWFPADLYLEGVDQYRGWFQSSFLTALVIEGQPPMRSIMSHGYTVDAQGRKMSKSLGNGVAPQEIIDKLGTDGLRLWTASIEIEGDVVVSPALIENVMRVYLKIRNTCRFFLQNLFDFDIAKDSVSYEKMRFIDRSALVHFAHFHEQMKERYLEGDLTAVFHGFADYCTVHLSAIYCDILKDRLYVAGANSLERRSAQTVLWHLVDGCTRLMAPILSFTSELVGEQYQHQWKESVHLQTFVKFDEILPEHLVSAGVVSAKKNMGIAEHAAWDALLTVRSVAMKLLEEQRAAGLIKHSLQARLIFFVRPDAPFAPAWQKLQETVAAAGETVPGILQEFLVISEFVVAHDERDLAKTELAGIFGRVEQAHGIKCPRCWQWRTDHQEDGLCSRCQGIITGG